MHFWIDNRSCGFLSQDHRRHFPVNWTAHRRNKTCFQPPMVTPVHRFPPIDYSLISENRRGSDGRQNSRRYRRSLSRERSREVSPHVSDCNNSTVHSLRNGSTTVEIHPTSSIDLQYRRVNTNQLFHLQNGKLLCFLWGGLMVITMFYVPSQVYQGLRREAIAILFISVVAFLICFSWAIFRSKVRKVPLNTDNNNYNNNHSDNNETITPNIRVVHANMHLNLRPLHVSQSQPNIVQYPPPRITTVPHSASTFSQQNIAPPTPSTTCDPPPYRVALLLPSTSQEECPESPPPSYEQAIK